MSGNFSFLRAEWPALFENARNAERDALFDPRTTIFYGRRTVELTVRWLYNTEGLGKTGDDNLSGLLGGSQFRQLVDKPVLDKMHYIRKLGNTVVHQEGAIQLSVATNVLAELFHIMSWLARRYATQPLSRPAPGARLNPALLRKPAGAVIAKTAAQLTALQAELAAKDTLLRTAEAEKADLLAQLAARDAELAELKSAEPLAKVHTALVAEVAAAKKAAAAVPDTHDYDEARTRLNLIDLLLRESGWLLDQERDREYPVTGMPGGKKGFVDYVLWGADGKPLAVIEAKRTSRDPHVGEEQAKLYADALQAQFGQRPVMYCTNGIEHRFWDDLEAAPRPIAGFHTQDQLELLIQRRRSRKPLAQLAINQTISGRYYQERAIRRVAERFESDKHRAALLVMATGSGKTRTVIGLTDLLVRANWAKRVLFLADRVALVNQAVNAFKSHLPDIAPVNLLTEKKTDSRVYLATYPTMMGLINQLEGGERRFGPGYFDLIIIDEAHRSVYQKYRHIFDYFDSRLLGLTATPKDEVHRNTYELFGLDTGMPTDDYPLEQAIKDGWLVPPRAVPVPLKFQREGVKYDDLDEDEQEQWESADWGDADEAPEEVVAEAVNKWFFNIDTVDKALAQLMERGHRVAGGDRLAKTIVFAKNNAHAQFIAERFNANYPEFRGEFARVITHKVEYAQSLIDDFSEPAKSPHIAISVDMLDTGIDVPDVANLMFFKPVRSKTKYWQMIGRGTRLRPDLFGPGQDKTDFFIFDLCGNFEYFGEHPDAAEGAITAPLSQRLFSTRVELIGKLDHAAAAGAAEQALRRDLADHLHELVAGMNLENFIVRPQRRAVERYRERTAWDSVAEESLARLVADLSDLPTTVRDNDEDAKRFDLLLLRCQLAALQDPEALGKLSTQVRDIADGLLEQLTIPDVKAHEELLRQISADEWWQDVTLPMLEHARRKLRAIVRLLEKRRRAHVITNLRDTLGEVVEVDLPIGVSFTDTERFTAKVRAFLLRQPDNLALQKVRSGRPLTESDLAALDELLARSGAGGEDQIKAAVAHSQGLPAFIRSLVGLDRQAATQAFADFLDGRQATADQIEFVNLIIDHLTRNGSMDAALLYEAPFTDIAPEGIEQIFTDDEADRIVLALRGLSESLHVA